jgi:hypothetical protein
MLKRLAGLLYLRRVARSLDAITASLDRQGDLLLRLVDHLAPPPPPADRAAVREDTGVSFLDPQEAYLAATYIARTQNDTGHIPTDEEVMIYLADEKTRDLAARLTARDVELTRLAESRL